MLLSGVTANTNVVLATEPDGTPVPAATSPLAGYLAPAQLRQAYGIDTLISAGHDGTGQTIAIIDAFNDPNIIADVNAFNTYYGLQRFNVPGGPTLTVLDQNGNAIPDQARTRHERVLSLAV